MGIIATFARAVILAQKDATYVSYDVDGNFLSSGILWKGQTIKALRNRLAGEVL